MTFSPINIGFYFFEPRFLKDQIFVRAQSWTAISGEKLASQCMKSTADGCVLTSMEITVFARIH